MKSRLAILVLVGILVACSGIPLRSLPRLMKLQNGLLELNPAEFTLAIQVDARMTPPAGGVPIFQLTIRPSTPGSFEAIDSKLPMRFTIASANALGLASPAADRRWLIYSFPPESQGELLRIQNYFKRIQAQVREKGGGSISVGISQEDVAARDPALAHTRWESWLQTSRREGFFELWSGPIAELLKQAKPADSGKSS
ncbi:MAG: hypothetical protein WCV99_24580 [Sterolibacterium sp.]|jgi:hypothetical protein